MKQLKRSIILLSGLLIVAIFVMHRAGSFENKATSLEAVESQKQEIPAADIAPEVESELSHSEKTDEAKNETPYNKSGLINIAEEVAAVERAKPPVIHPEQNAVAMKSSSEILKAVGDKSAHDEPEFAKPTIVEARVFDPAVIRARVDLQIKKAIASGTLKPGKVRAYRDYLTRLANEEALGEQQVMGDQADGVLFADGTYLEEN